MWALPAELDQPVSCWTQPGEERNSRLARLDQVDVEPATTAVTQVLDPPWILENDTTGNARVEQLKPEQSPNTGFAPPTVGVDQHCTTVELVKHRGVYSVVIDGVQMPDAAPEHTNEEGVPRYWLPRFREVVAAPSNPSESAERTVAPLCVGVRLEEEEVAPARVVVSMRQRITDHGYKIMDPYDKDLSVTEVLREELLPYSVADHSAGFALLPYPAAITRQPIITVIDMDERRRWEFAARKWKWSRTLSVVRNIAGLFILWTNPTAAAGIGVGKLVQSLAKSYNDVSPAKAMWKALLLKTSPSIRYMVEAVTATADITWFGFEATKEPPTQVRGYDFSIGEFVAALKYIAETRSDGTSKSRPRGMSPIEMSREGRKKEAALLYWLVYGNESVVKGDAFKYLGEENDPQRSWIGSIAQWPTWLRWNSKELTGNLLDTRGLDPYMASQSRVDYVMRIIVEERDGTVKEFDFEALRSNAIDAGYILTNVEEDLQELREVMDKVKLKLESMREYGFSWIHQTLYVSDGRTGSFITEWVPGAAAAQRLLGRSLDDDERRLRWRELQTSREGGPIAALPPLIIKPRAFMNRLLLLLYGTSTKFDADGNVVPEDPDARIERRRNEAAPATFVGITGPTSSGLPTALFDRWMEQLSQLFLKITGIPRRSADGVAQTAERWYAFWRWVDAYVPVLGSPDDFRLSAFVVPKPVDFKRRQPVLVRRLPQLGIVTSKLVSNFGATSILPVKLVPADPLSERTMAKAAVTTAKRCWTRTIRVYRRLRWTVELTDFYGAPNSFHFLQFYSPVDPDALPALARLPILVPAESSVNVLAMLAAQPEDVTAAEATAEQFPMLADAWARAAASGARRLGDAGDLQTFKLRGRREALLALQSYAAIVVYKAIQHSAELRRRDLVQSSVSDANYTATAAAGIIDSLYGSNTKRNGLVSRDDIFFACIPHAPYARAALLQLDCWRSAQRASRSQAAFSTEFFHREWPKLSRERTSAFAQALRALASSSVSPLKIPIIALQCLWYTGNPTVDRLLGAGDVAVSGMELQIREAAASFRRVQAMVTSIPTAEQNTASLAALHVTVACRPVIFVAWMEGHRERVARALRASTASVRRIAPVPVAGNRAALKMRCAGLRLDSTFAMRNEQVLRESVDDVLNRMATLSLDSGARYLVPMGSKPYSATPLDLSNAPALEDVVVWRHHVAEAMHRQDVADISSLAGPPGTWFGVVAVADVRDGKARHPQLIELWSNRGEMFMCNMPALEPGLLAPLADALPVTMDRVLDSMKRYAQTDLEKSLTWTLAQRTRALMWNIDRVIQLMLLCEVTMSDPSRPMFIRTDELNAASRPVACVAIAIAHAAIRSIYPAKAGVLAYILERDLAIARELLRKVGRVVGGEERPVPLSELCVVVAALCP